MSLEHPKNKVYIRFLRIIELIFVFPITIIIVLIVCPKEITIHIKELLNDWVKWFKDAQDFEYL